MNKPDKKDYLENIFLHEVARWQEAVLLGEQELALSERSIIKRKEDLLQVRLKYRLAKEELERVRNER